MRKLIFFIIFSIFLNNNISVFATEQITATTTEIEAISTKETVIKTYEFPGNIEYKNLIPNKIEYKGQIFEKKDIKVDEQKRSENIDVVESVDKIILESEKQNAITLFDKELHYKFIRK